MSIDAEDRIAHLRLRIREQEQTISQLEQECNHIEADLAEFEARYNKLIKPLVNQIEAVKSALEKLRDLHLMQQMGQKLHLEALWRKRPTIEFDPDKPLNDEQPLPKQADSSRYQSLKKLYRHLARRYHPDLASDDQDRQNRTKIMALINTAYQEQDIESLRALDEATPQQEAALFNSRLPLEMMLMRRLQRQYEDLCVQVRDLQERRHYLRYGPMMELKIEASLAQARGEDLLESLAEDMQKEYWRYVSELDELRDTVN